MTRFGTPVVTGARRRSALLASCFTGTLLACLSLPAALTGQTSGTVVGVVMDRVTLTPIEGAVVSLPGLDLTALTDENGTFEVTDVPSGEPIIRVERSGYVTYIETTTVAPLEASLIHFHLDRLTAVLDLLTVEAIGRGDPRPGHSEANVPGGDAVRSAADLLARNVPGVTVQERQGRTGDGVTIRLRGVSSFELAESPHVYLDGARIDAGGLDGAMLTLAEIPAASVARIRVLRGPASTSLYPQAAAGVILVETMPPPE